MREAGSVGGVNPSGVVGEWSEGCGKEIAGAVRLSYPRIMSMKKLPAIDEDKYRGEWIAIDPKTRRIVAHDMSLHKALETARRRGVEDPLMHGVPESDGYFVGQSIAAG
jgi:hypothetical protein